jgi:hypothetical protein
MTSEDAFVVRTLIERMKRAAAGNSEVMRLADELMGATVDAVPLPKMQYPDIHWIGNTMVVG